MSTPALVAKVEESPVAAMPRVLFLDHEGGWGGSSRSLYYIVEARRPEWWHAVVVSRKPGLIGDRYAALGVPHHLMPDLPTFRPAERNNWLAFLIFLRQLVKLPKLIRELRALAADETISLLHINHENLALFGSLAGRALGLPWVCHVRTQLHAGFYARLVNRVINRHAARIIFITERNREHFAALVGARFQAAKTTVVHNAAPPFNSAVTPLPELGESLDVLRVLSLSNFSPNRGVDRIVDVAEALAQRGRRDIVFFLCGKPANTSRLPGAKVRYTDDMLRRVAEGGLADMVRFPGHVAAPERALVACEVLIKLTRQDNPWGRDIIEAMAAGLPVVTVGEFQDFVADGVNGFIDRTFDAERVADHLIRLQDDTPLRARMAAANRDKAGEMFDGGARAAEVAQVYRKALGACA